MRATAPIVTWLQACRRSAGRHPTPTGWLLAWLQASRAWQACYWDGQGVWACSTLVSLPSPRGAWRRTSTTWRSSPPFDSAYNTRQRGLVYVYFCGQIHIIHVFIYIFVYIYIHIYTYIYIYIFIYIYICMCMYVYIYIYIWLCICFN